MVMGISSYNNSIISSTISTTNPSVFTFIISQVPYTLDGAIEKNCEKILNSTVFGKLSIKLLNLT